MTPEQLNHVEYVEPLPEWVQRPEVITLDGLAATGTTTLGKLFQERLGYRYLSVSSIARSLSAAYLERGLPLDDESTIEAFYADVRFELTSDGRFFADGVDQTSKLFRPENNTAASHLFGYEVVRNRTAEESAGVIRSGNVVLDGRNVGSEVAPGAELQVYLTADFDERVRRRTADDHDEDTVRRELAARDSKERSGGADRSVPNAIIVDTTHTNPLDCAQAIIETYNRRLNVPG